MFGLHKLYFFLTVKLPSIKRTISQPCPHLIRCLHFSRTYNQLWADAQLELSRLLTEELPAEPPRPEKDRVVFFQRLAMLYVRYIQIFRQLEKVYDQVVHPQKRRVIRVILDGVIGRVLELKNEMVEKEFSEYHYMDDVLHDLKLTPVSFIFENLNKIALIYPCQALA